MPFLTVLFYAFAGILIFAALRVITTRNPVHAALWLVLSFFSAASIWMLLQAEFLAILLVVVYVGAVMVLFLFVVMMLDVNFEALRTNIRSYVPSALIVGLLVLLEMALVIAGVYHGTSTAAPPAAATNNTRDLGLVVYTTYVYPFEIAAVVLLVAIVAAIALTLRQRRKTRKFQDPGVQTKVQASERLRIIRMPAERSGD